MGCDIHILVEAKHKDSKGWFLTDLDFNINRDYDLFKRIAGVRGPGPAPLGFPEDISDGSKFTIDRWGVDGHSHTYMSIEDLCKLTFEHTYDTNTVARLKIQKNGNKLTDNELRYIKGYDYGKYQFIESINDNEMNDYEQECKCEYRAIIFFDN